MVTPVSPLLRPTSYMTWLSEPGKTPLPPPMSSMLVYSAKRDASFVQCEFDGHVPRSMFQRNVILMYGDRPTLWNFGADEYEQRTVSGKATTMVKFRIGPFRLAPVTKFLASYYLYEELLGQRTSLLDSAALLRPLSTATPPYDVTQTTRAGYWLYVLANGNAPSVASPAGPNRAGHLDDLDKSINLRAFQGFLTYDDVVVELYEAFLLMTIVNPDYLQGVTQAQLDDPMLQNLIPDPQFIMRHVLDPPTAWYSTTEMLQLPMADDREFRASAPFSIRRNEDTLIQMWRDPLETFPTTPVNRNPHNLPLEDGATLWRYGMTPPVPAGSPPPVDTWNDWTIIGEGSEDRRYFPGLNPHTLYAPMFMPSLPHANLESEIQRDQHELPLRIRKVTAAAPRDRDELLQFLPTNACRVRSVSGRFGNLPVPEQPHYWITELRVTQPAMTMQLDLVYPGEDPLGDLA